MESVSLSRTKIHEKAMLCIFQYLFYNSYSNTKNLSYKKPIEEIISDIMEINFDECDEFFKVIIFETIKNKNEYSALIESKLNKWKFTRLCLSDQAILLLFTSEIINKRAPSQVCIDVAVDLAHRYCADTSYKYINKVLDLIGKDNA